jgi:hypothetical protein
MESLPTTNQKLYLYENSTTRSELRADVSASSDLMLLWLFTGAIKSQGIIRVP